MTVDEYEAKVASGEIAEDSRVELIDGRLVRKVTKNTAHSFSVCAVHDSLTALVPRRLLGTSGMPGPHSSAERARTGCIGRSGDASPLQETSSGAGGYRPHRRGCGFEPR